MSSSQYRPLPLPPQAVCKQLRSILIELRQSKDREQSPTAMEREMMFRAGQHPHAPLLQSSRLKSADMICTVALQCRRPLRRQSTAQVQLGVASEAITILRNTVQITHSLLLSYLFTESDRVPLPLHSCLLVRSSTRMKILLELRLLDHCRLVLHRLY